MKSNIIKIYIFVLTVFMVSCKSEDNPTIDVTNKDVVGTIDVLTVPTSEDDELVYTLTFPEAFPSDADIRVSVRLKDGRNKVQTITLPQGDTSITSKIYTPASSGYSFGFNRSI